MEHHDTADHSTPMPRRALWRLGRGRAGGSLGCAVIAHRAIMAKRTVRVADGDMNNPTLSRTYPSDGPFGVERPRSHDMEAIKQWLAATLAESVHKNTSVVIDMGGGDRVAEGLTAESDLGTILQDSGFRATFAYFSGPERDDFDHIYRIWKTGAFSGGDSILFLNEGLSRIQSASFDPFEWLRADKRLSEMGEAGVAVIRMPALTCMKYLEEGDLTVFEALAGKSKSDGSTLNLLWKHMTKKWLERFIERLDDSEASEWLP